MSIRRRVARATLNSHLRRIVPVAIVATVAFIILTSLTGSARAWLRPTTTVVEPTVLQTQAAAPALLLIAPSPPAVAREQRMEALIIKLRRTGFEPVEITRPQGRFLLAFDNRTGADEIVLQLQHETGNKLHEVRMPRGNVRWRQALDLHPGRYVLTVADHPEWVCHITITPR